jgi:SpoVK/Ycf46/Vps4 family AAA+-type ATPase
LRDLLVGRLDAVAARVDSDGAEEFLALADAAHAELDALVTRCRHREALAEHAGHGPGAAGVRALLTGPSGAGKSLAARCLARRAGKDLWRIDLAATVSKYIGETERALDRAFAAAEERDVVLLLDEGDALMTRRTDVGSANDRYANLETNFLLQRMETFSGILIVTTNAADRIDPAFQRRMDAVIHFPPADALARYEILLHHLGAHQAGDELVQEIAARCTLSGGQLRNVALHARLLALDGDGRLGDRELRRAVEREYRKLAGFCPLKPLLRAVV